MRERSYRLAAGGVWKENIPVKLERGARVYAEWGYGFSESGTFATATFSAESHTVM